MAAPPRPQESPGGGCRSGPLPGVGSGWVGLGGVCVPPGPSPQGRGGGAVGVALPSCSPGGLRHRGLSRWGGLAFARPRGGVRRPALPGAELPGAVPGPACGFCGNNRAGPRGGGSRRERAPPRSAAGVGTRRPSPRRAFLEAFVGACSPERFEEARRGTCRGGERIVCDMWQCCCSFLSKREEALGQLVAESGPSPGVWGSAGLGW